MSAQVVESHNVLPFNAELINKYSKYVKTISKRVVEVEFCWFQKDPRQSFNMRMTEKQFEEAKKNIRSKKLLQMKFETFSDLIAVVFANDADIDTYTLRNTFDHLFDQNNNGTIEREEFESLLTLLQAFHHEKHLQNNFQLTESFSRVFEDRNNHISFKAKRATALITGSTSGIGHDLAKGFAAKGYNIVVNGTRKEGYQIAEQLKLEHNIDAIYLPANMKNADELNTVVEKTLEKFERIDVLINNAGVQYVAPIDEFPIEKWRDIIDINLTSAFVLSKAVWQQMKKQHFGRIINMASVHSLVASEYKTAYVSSKHALIGLTKVLALEGAPHGITVNSLCPGYVRTPLVDKQIHNQAKYHNISEEDVISKILLTKHAIKEFVTTDTLTELTLFLASAQASTISGTAIPIDCAWSSS
ncbi:unnamed protein product [Didymodactylos carnosus]|uniref:3-oxoacyl-[acyl-carrier-protein] reductase n=1 Tax=Didymodactylos carnosus TaxID=1234261 RepID=A0A813REW8_9BILA|nr:unnamed protein product [Didymodactylos carnosus]CAF1411304.1 unnamed protein product [Didymodactylos carnosus]CAF3563649.1 unnamed protein product [Didymodactylos carnosus]CAF4215185.1 unnamed protein product [Didymodactylos carnosus]